MSNQLTSLVPVLDGTNYKSWRKSMAAYLKSSDLWEYVDGTEPEVQVPPAHADADVIAAYKAWRSANNKAVGSILLRVNSAIQPEIITIDNATTMWNRLSALYDIVSIATIYKYFKEATSVRLDGVKHPQLQINRMANAVHQLIDEGISLPDNLQAMILLAAIPSKWDFLVSVVSSSYETDELTFKDVKEVIIAQWETDRNQKRPSHSTNKLSAVKRKHGDPSYRQQQRDSSQQRQQQTNGDPQRKRGKRGGKKKQGATGHSHIANVASRAAPTTATTMEISPKGLETRISKAPAPKERRPSSYATLNDAYSLADDIDVTPTIQTVKRLEEHVITQRSKRPIASLKIKGKAKAVTPPPSLSPESSAEDTSDEEVSAHSDLEGFNVIKWWKQNTRMPKRAKSTGDPSRAPTPAVSLDWGTDYDVEAEIAKAAGINDLHFGEDRSVPSHRFNNACIDKHSINKNVIDLTRSECLYKELVNIVLCAHNKTYATCGTCKGEKALKREAPWLIDSGASAHFTGDKDDLLNYEEVNDGPPVKTATTTVRIQGKGAMLIKFDLPVRGSNEIRTLRLYPVFYIPQLTTKLLSMGTLLQSGLTVLGDQNQLLFISAAIKAPLMICRPLFTGHTTYWIQARVANHNIWQSNEAHLIYKVDYDLMHRRFGHPSKEVLRRAKDHTKGFPKDLEIPSEIAPCPACAQGKMPQSSHKPSETHAAAPFEKIHSDLKSFPVASYHKYKYFVSFFDDYSSHAWVVLLKHKSNAILALKQFIAMVHNVHNASIKQWMSDAGGEYKSVEFIKVLKDNGIQILQSAPHTPQQNGRAERFMRTCMDKAQAMRFQACLPQSWWEFAVLHAVHCYNRTPLARVKGVTPYELVHKVKPDISHLRVFGCGAYVHIPEECRVNKLAPKSELMVYLGHADGMKAFMFMRTSNNTLFYSTTALFDEEVFPKCDTSKVRSTTRVGAPRKDQDSADGDDFPPSTGHTHPQPIPGGNDKGKAKAPNHDTPNHEQSEEEDRAQDPDEDPVVSEEPDLQRRSPSPPADPVPLRRSARLRNIPTRPDNVYGERRHPTAIQRDINRSCTWKQMTQPGSSRTRTMPGGVSDDSSHPEQAPNSPEVLSDPPESEDEVDDMIEKLAHEGGVQFVNHLLAKAVPLDDSLPPDNIREWTYKDILRMKPDEQKEWKAACREELEALRRRDVFKLVDPPKGRKIIRNRWVFDQKTDGRKKARLVAKGFSQVEGVDFNEIFSPVVRFETVRMMLALAALENWHITGLDVKSAFLYGELDEELYMEQPEGFKIKGQEHKVLRLLRAIYGLKQAALAWWKALDKSMAALKCKRLLADSGIFVFRKDNDLVVIIVYVDDALFMGNNRARVHELKNKFMKQWECRDLGDTQEFLRMRILRKDGSLYLDQTAYLTKVLQRFGLTNAKAAQTPLPEGYQPMPIKGPVDPSLRTKYQQVIGSLLYIMLGTRPDIAYAVTKLSQFAANPSQEHLNKALYICRYLVGTQHYALRYNGAGGKGLLAFADSDWASDPNNRRSTTGYLVKLADAVFSWNSRAQKTIALSSTEAEYMSLSDTSRQLVWIRTLFSELGIKLSAIPLCGDNQGSIFMASNPVQEKQIKHIDICFHYIHQVVRDKQVELFFIDGALNPADMFTKNLGHIKFVKFRSQLGLEFYSPDHNAQSTSVVALSEGEC